MLHLAKKTQAGSARAGLGLLLFSLLLTGCGKPRSVTVVIPTARPKAAAETQFQIQLDPNSPNAFEVTGLTGEEVYELARADLTKDKWPALFAVRVNKDAPAIPGAYSILDKAVHFDLAYPMVPGVTYRAEFHPDRMPRPRPKAETVVAVFSVQKPAAPPTVVQGIYPTADLLPENQLKFYIHFSAPMSRGEAYEHIKLLDANGKPIESVFLELGEELWDPGMKRFTLLFDPGRIKHGLKPREDLGPTLEQGKSYTLVVDKAWHDANGTPLKEGFRKSFKAGPAFDKPVDPRAWKLTPPAAGATDPLIVALPVPHDHALLLREVWVTDAAGQRLPGAVTVADREQRWQFTPEAPWKAGSYRLAVKTTLEDLAGNKVGQLFEVDVFKPIQKELKVDRMDVGFEVK